MATRLDYFGNDDREGDGPALKLCTDLERRFVLLYVAGEKKGVAVREAGYSAGVNANVQQWRLLRKPRILAAIQEEVQKRLASSGVLGMQVLEEVARDKQHKDRLKAGRELLAHAGLAPVVEQKMTVEHTTLSAEAVRAKLRLLMGRIPEAPKLLEAAGLVVDAEFSVVDVERPAE